MQFYLMYSRDIAMLKGPSRSQSKTFHLTANDNLIPEDSIQAVVIQVEKALKQIELNGDSVVLNVQHNQKTWKFMVVLKDADKSQKKIKLKDVDLYVIDENLILGEGSQGKVVLAQHIPSGRFAATKIQKPSSPSFDDDLKIERRNLSLTERLYGYASVTPADEFLIKDLPTDYSPDQLECVRSKETTHYTLMKFFQGRNLNEFLYELDKTQSKDSPVYFAEKRQLDILSIGRLAVHAIQEVLYLHGLGVAHRDIKTDNYVVNTLGLLQECTELRLTDLGTALLPASERSKDDASTFGYMPPEYLVDGKDRPYWDENCDRFQLGIVLAEIFTKYNYQAGLKKHALDQQQASEKKHLTFEQIKELMPDAFAKVKKPKKKSKSEAIEKNAEATSEEALKEQLFYKIHSLIHLLTDADRVKRAQVDLKALFSELRAVLGRAHTVIQLNNSHKRFEAFKMHRKNTVLDLSKLKAESSSPSVSSSSGSVAPQDDDSVSHKTLVRRKSVGQLQVGSVIRTVEDAPLTERPSRSQSTSASRKRSISSSTREAHKIESAPKPSSSATADLVEKMEDLSLESEQEQVIAKLAKVHERLMLLNAPKPKAAPASSEQGVLSDILMFSLLGKQVKDVVKEPNADAQQRQLNRLANMTRHYQPTKNETLNNEMLTVSKLLANYPK